MRGMIVLVSRVSLGSFSSHKIVSATVLYIPFIEMISGAYYSKRILDRVTLSEVRPKPSRVRFLWSV